MYIVIRGKPTHKIALKDSINGVYSLVARVSIFSIACGIAVSSSILWEYTSDNITFMLWAKGSSIVAQLFIFEAGVFLIAYLLWPFVCVNILKRKLIKPYKLTIFNLKIWHYTEEEQKIVDECDIRFKNKVRTKFPWLFKKNSVKSIDG